MAAARSEGDARRATAGSALLDGALDGIAVVRQSDGAIVYANAALERILDAGPQELATAVRALMREGRVDTVELAHPEAGVIRLIVVPRESRRRSAERSWRRDLRRELARAMRREWPLTIAALALDAGASPHTAAAAWGSVLREEDSLAPFEGGTYLLVLPDCPTTAALGVAERVKNASPPPATVSIGIATWVAEEPLQSLLARALEALAAARAAGGDQASLAADPPDPAAEASV